MSLIPNVKPAVVADIAVGIHAPERLLTTVMARSRGELLQELHTFSSPEGLRALERAIGGGARVRLLANGRYVTPSRLPGLDATLRLEQYGARTLDGVAAYQHSKLLASSSGLGGLPEAVFTNVSLMPDSHLRPDVAVRLVGDSAEAVRTYLDASLGRDLSRLAQAADDARAGGLLVNDPVTGRSHLTEGIRALVDGARQRITIVSKGLDDADLAARLVQARARGVEVSLSLRDLSRSDARVLADGGVRVVMHATDGAASRINAIVADDEVLFSTAYQWQHMLRPGAPMSRESGVLLGGADARRAIAALADTPQGSAVLDAAGVRARVPAGRLPQGFQPLQDVLLGQRLVAALD